jgi:hypothetical protein
MAQVLSHVNPIEMFSTPSSVIVRIEKETEVTVSHGNNVQKKLYPYLYLNVDGWMVVYFPKDSSASEMMQWNNYTPGQLETTLLRDMINEMVFNIDSSYSGDVKYYHFQYPQANRLTIVVETVFNPNQKDNNFSVIIPGIVHEASYSMYYSYGETGVTHTCNLALSVDTSLNRGFFRPSCDGKYLENASYPSIMFQGNTPHLVRLSLTTDSLEAYQGGVASVFVYEI